MGSEFNPYFILILLLTLFVPVLVMPHVVDNAFNTPKTLLILIGVSLMVGIYCFCFLRGRPVLRPTIVTTNIILFLIIFNFISFFYTKNPYFTSKAIILNISCLLLFYFISIYTDERRAFLLIIASALSGLLVAIISWLQFFDIHILIRWASPGEMIMGTIGNSNYLGAYLIFPLFSMAGLIFLLKGRLRLIPALLFVFIMGAFLFSGARAGWFGFFLTFPFFLWLLKRIHGISISAYIRSRKRQAAGCLIVLLAILMLLWFAAPKRFNKMMNPRKVFGSETLRLRLTKYFPPSIWLFKQSPIYGTGLWSYRNMVYKAQAEINRANPGFFENYDSPKPRRVHNEYLEILNDGGLVGAAALFLFLALVMAHGWYSIKDEKVRSQDKVVIAICFCSIIAIMLTSFFFFSFRVNSTMFMTVLMMGLMEGAYLRYQGLISKTKGQASMTSTVMIPMLFLLLTGIIWYAGIRPYRGEREHFQYRRVLVRGDIKGAERHILKAIFYDPHNSAYHLYAGQLYMNLFKDYVKAGDFVERAITDFNGNITLWSAWFIKGLVKFRMGSVLEARKAFKKSLYYNPTFQPAQQQLAKVEKVLEEHDSVMIKLK
ncbi:O-antigen ligase family protein [Thermodesulfobacteriota bacterium]